MQKITRSDNTCSSILMWSEAPWFCGRLSLTCERLAQTARCIQSFHCVSCAAVFLCVCASLRVDRWCSSSITEMTPAVGGESDDLAVVSLGCETTASPFPLLCWFCDSWQTRQLLARAAPPNNHYWLLIIQLGEEKLGLFWQRGGDGVSQKRLSSDSTAEEGPRVTCCILQLL